jgi:ureidoglycolate hydrolase
MGKILEIKDYQGKDYKPLVDFADWRVAILNFVEGCAYQGPKERELERHLLTDEVFVLLKGRATLIIGGNKKVPSKIKLVKMEQGKLYNVKKGSWHGVLMKKNAKILIVESRNTSDANTEYAKCQLP